MTKAEFKAWFDGFTEALSGVPNKAQWERIKARVAEIDGAPVTERVYIDRYWPSYPHRPYWSYLGATTGYATMASGISSSAGSVTGLMASAQNSQFSPTSAMLSLGKAEYQSLS